MIAAAAQVAQEDELVVIGSQAILGSYPDAGLANGVRSTPCRMVPRAHDLVLAKCVAGRERDWEFARDALAAGLVEADILLSRVGDLPISAEAQDRSG